MEENKIWANLNDSYNLDVILIENEALKNFVPKKEIIKPEQPKPQVQNIDMEEINIEYKVIQKHIKGDVEEALRDYGLDVLDVECIEDYIEK